MQAMRLDFPASHVGRAIALLVVASLFRGAAHAEVFPPQSSPQTERDPADAAARELAAINIGAGIFVAPLDPHDLPTRSAASVLAQPEIAERAAERARLWTTLQNQVREAGAAMHARTWELGKAGIRVQTCWDIARTDELPKWIAKIEATNDAILKLECTESEAALARRRAWARCRAFGGHNRGDAAEDAAAAFDADLWLLDLAREKVACVDWLQPLFQAAPDCPEQWLALRNEFAAETTALRAQHVRARLAATEKQAREPERLIGDAPPESTMKQAEARLHAWRQHNERYLARIEALAVELNRVVDAALLRCKFLHAENKLLIGEQAVHANLLCETAQRAIATHPERAAELTTALTVALSEYARASDQMVDSILKSDRRSRRWLAGARDSTELVIEASKHAQELGAARQRLMDQQLAVALGWIADEPEGDLAIMLRALRESAEMDSWGQWRFVLQFQRDVMDAWLNGTMKVVTTPQSETAAVGAKPDADKAQGQAEGEKQGEKPEEKNAEKEEGEKPEGEQY